MSAPAYNSLLDAASIRSIESEDVRHDSGNVSPSLRPKLKAEYLDINDQYLSAPHQGPIRPLSPDTLSNLSAGEYDAMRLDRQPEADATTTRDASTWRGWFHAFWVKNLGLGYMLLGQVFGTLMNVATRILEVEGNNGKGMHPFQILFARMGITFVLASAYMWWQKTPHFPLGAREVRLWLVARGLGGFCGVFGMYYSLLYLPLADATVLTFLSPGIANWACSKLINEPFTRGEQVGTLVSLLGVVFIAKPTTLFAAFANGNTPAASGSGDAAPSNGTMPADASNYDNVTASQRLTAVGIAMIGVLGSATAYTTIRAISTRAHPLITVNYFAGWCFLVSIAAQTFIPGIGFVLPADSKEWGLLIFLGVCGFTMQFLLAAGLSYEKSSRATNIAYTQMLFALGFEKLMFGHSPDTMSIIGSGIIMGAAIVVAFRKGSGSAQPSKESTAQAVIDEEATVGLISSNDTADDGERPAMEDVQLRPLR